MCGDDAIVFGGSGYLVLVHLSDNIGGRKSATRKKSDNLPFLRRDIDVPSVSMNRAFHLILKVFEDHLFAAGVKYGLSGKLLINSFLLELHLESQWSKSFGS